MNIKHTGVLISPQPDQEGNKLQQPNSNFCKPLKNNSEGCPSKCKIFELFKYIDMNIKHTGVLISP